MSVLRQSVTTTGPLAIAGRTITLVARTRTIGVMTARRGVVHVRARPHYVEVLDGGRRRQVVPIRDVQGIVTSAIVTGAAACVVGRYCARRFGRHAP